MSSYKSWELIMRGFQKRCLAENDAKIYLLHAVKAIIACDQSFISPYQISSHSGTAFYRITWMNALYIVHICYLRICILILDNALSTCEDVQCACIIRLQIDSRLAVSVHIYKHKYGGVLNPLRSSVTYKMNSLNNSKSN